MSECLLSEKAPSSLPDIFLCFLIVEAFQGGGTFGAAEIRPLLVPGAGLCRIGQARYDTSLVFNIASNSCRT